MLFGGKKTSTFSGIMKDVVKKFSNLEFRNYRELKFFNLFRNYEEGGKKWTLRWFFTLSRGTTMTRIIGRFLT